MKSRDQYLIDLETIFDLWLKEQDDSEAIVRLCSNGFSYQEALNQVEAWKA